MRRFIALSSAVLASVLGPLAAPSQAEDNVTVTGVKLVRGNLSQVTGTVTCPQGYVYGLGFELYQQTGLRQTSGYGGTFGACTGEQQTFVADVSNWEWCPPGWCASGPALLRRGVASA